MYISLCDGYTYWRRGRERERRIASDIPVSRVVVKVVSRAFHLAAPWVDLTVAVMVAWWVVCER